VRKSHDVFNADGSHYQIQLCLIKLLSSAEHPYSIAIYGTHYQGKRRSTASKSFLKLHQGKIN
jgi:hypothetical protein